MQLQSIPLDQLVLSPMNVRKTGTEDVGDLVASIAAQGILQNLNVTQGREFAPGEHYYEVIAGGRRLRALKELAARGNIGHDFPVPCAIVDADTAAETSAAENIIRAPMHPADEFEAFKDLAGQHYTNLEIATRFGCDEKHVERLLRLANVSPRILQLFREDSIELDQVMALASTEDHARQEKAWDAAKNSPWQREPDRLRRAIAQNELSPDTDGIAAFVGTADYIAAGGQVRKDIFATEGTGEYFVDAALARKVAQEKLQKRADQLKRDGWSWAEARLDFSYAEENRFSRIYQAKVGGKSVWPEEGKAYAGCVVTISQQGKADIRYGLVRKGDKEKYEAKKKKQQAEAKGGKAPAAITKPAAKAKPGGPLPFSAVQRLQGLRAGVIQRHLATNQHAALAALAAALEDGSPGVRIGRRGEYLDRPHPNVAEGMSAAPTHDAWVQQCDRYMEGLEKASAEHPDLFHYLLASPIERTLEVLQHHAADAFLIADKEKPGKVDPGRNFLQAVGLDMAQHWTPTVEWLATLQPGVVRVLVADACGKKDAALVAKLKGPELAKKAAELLAAKQWLPEPLRHPEAKKPKDAKQKAAGDAG